MRIYLRVRPTLAISCEAVTPPVCPAGAQGGTLYARPGAALSFDSCIALFDCSVRKASELPRRAHRPERAGLSLNGHSEARRRESGMWDIQACRSWVHRPEKSDFREAHRPHRPSPA
jgi:hypothetical protein